MLNLISPGQKPMKSHRRAQTTPLVRDPAAQAISSPVNCNTRCLPSIPSMTPDLNGPREPPQIHQRPITLCSSPRPHLTVNPSTGFNDLQPECETLGNLTIDHQLQHFSHSPESSRRSSPSREGNRIDSTYSDSRPARFASWFQGESGPVKVSLIPSPSKEKGDPLASATATSAVRSENLHRKSLSQVAVTKAAMASRFSFFGSRPSLSKSAPLPTDLNDEMLQLDTSTALVTGYPDQTTPSPTAYKNLQQHADRLLGRMQAAYRERTTLLRDTIAEKEALREETQGAETRAVHLKMQLDAMSAKVAEQDAAMMDLVDELAREKLARREEEEARKRSLRHIAGHNALMDAHDRRGSGAETVSDSGFESEDESSADSVFSKHDGVHSRTMSMSSVSTGVSPEIYQATEVVYSPTRAAQLRVPSFAPAPKRAEASSAPMPEIVRQVCVACQGDNINTNLRQENENLKSRVEELEGALDGCLDVVGRLGG